jgi:alpha-tubulin suppressor-like RCC1 family protein/lysophospholipase L1-like esterase
VNARVLRPALWFVLTAAAVLHGQSAHAGSDGIAAGGGDHFASFSHTCAVVAGGLQCWGAGESGQLGHGLLPGRSPLPVDVIPAGSGVTAVAAGTVHSCALVAGSVHCFGGNGWRQGGPSRPYVITSPQPVAGVPKGVSRIGAGGEHSCAIAAGGVWCWGRNGDGQAGDSRCRASVPLMKCKAPPARVGGLVGDPTAIALGARHTCVLIAGGVQCWGANDRGQLGDGADAARRVPAPVIGLPGVATALTAGGHHTCAIVESELYCWGANAWGQLGDGTTRDAHTPVAVVGLGARPAVIAAGAAHTCAVVAEGVQCWGDGREGQLDGVLRPAPVTSPVAVPMVASSPVALAAGRDHSCAMREDAHIQCWGDNDFGQLGSGDAPNDHARPVVVARWDDGRLFDRNGDGRIAVGCLGDSNTHSIHTSGRGWCERLAELAPADGWRFENRGEGGATAVTGGSLIHADEHLAYALENDALDAVILAYGTNDLLFAKASPVEVANAISRLRQRAHGHGLDVFVALVPPIQPGAGGGLADVAALNAILRERFPASRVVDFHTGMDPADFQDGVHLGPGGQRKRAEAAWEALSGVAEPAGPQR